MAANFDTYFARKHRYEYERGPLRDLLLNIPLVPQSFTVKAQPSIIYQADFFLPFVSAQIHLKITL